MSRLRTFAAALALTQAAAAQTSLSNQDDCANATLDVVGPGAYAASTLNATTGSEGQNESNCLESGNTAVLNDVWFVYTPSTTGRVRILACGFGPTVGGKIAVYPGTGCPADGTSLACDGEHCPAQGGGALVELDVTFGSSYLVQLGNGFPGARFAGTVWIGESLGGNYCTPAVPNSTGMPGRIAATGSGSVARNDVTLTATQLPPGEFGYFLVSRTQGFFQPPASQGPLCLSGDVGRYNHPREIVVGPDGSVEIDLGLVPVNPPAAVQPGETWNFQAWYRDNAPASTSNFTDALSVTFQ